MKNILIIIILLSCSLTVIASSAQYFDYNKNKILLEFTELSNIENNILNNKFDVNINLYKNQIKLFKINTNLNQITAPGKIPSFWFAFIISTVGTYTLYGAGLGPTAVAIVALASKKDMEEIKKASLGCLIGTALGGGIKWLIMSGKAAVR